jgi:hypothetical protein
MARVEALTTGQLLDRVFSLYTKNFALFFSIAAIPQLIYLVFASIPALSVGFGAIVPGTPTAIVVSVGSVIVGYLFKIMALGVSQGAATVAVSDLYLGQPTAVGKCYRQTMPLTWRLIGLVLGYGLLVGLGFFLLIVPGVYWAITYALAVAVMAIERVSFSEAMSRSGDLVKGNRGRIAIIFLLNFVLNIVIVYGLTLPTVFLSVLIAKGHPTMAHLMTLVVGTLAGALSSPIGLIGFTLAYYDARVRKEAFDLEYMMQTDALPPAPVPPAPAAPDANAAGSGQ